MFGDADELQRRMAEFAEQLQGQQRLAWADNAIKLAVDMTVAAINRINLQGNAEQQAQQVAGRDGGRLPRGRDARSRGPLRPSVGRRPPARPGGHDRRGAGRRSRRRRRRDRPPRDRPPRDRRGRPRRPRRCRRSRGRPRRRRSSSSSSSSAYSNPPERAGPGFAARAAARLRSRSSSASRNVTVDIGLLSSGARGRPLGVRAARRHNAIGSARPRGSRPRSVEIRPPGRDSPRPLRRIAGGSGILGRDRWSRPQRPRDETTRPAVHRRRARWEDMKSRWCRRSVGAAPLGAAPACLRSCP